MTNEEFDDVVGPGLAFNNDVLKKMRNAFYCDEDYAGYYAADRLMKQVYVADAQPTSNIPLMRLAA